MRKNIWIKKHITEIEVEDGSRGIRNIDKTWGTESKTQVTQPST